MASPPPLSPRASGAAAARIQLLGLALFCAAFAAVACALGLWKGTGVRVPRPGLVRSAFSLAAGNGKPSVCLPRRGMFCTVRSAPERVSRYQRLPTVLHHPAAVTRPGGKQISIHLTRPHAAQQDVINKNDVVKALGLGEGAHVDMIANALSGVFGSLHTSPAALYGAATVLHRANAICAVLWLISLRFQFLRWLQAKMQKVRAKVMPIVRRKSNEDLPNTPYERSIYPPLETPLEVLSWWTLLVSYLFGSIANFFKMNELSLQIAISQNVAGRIAMGWIILNYITYFKEKSSRGKATFGDILGADTSRRESQVSAVAQTLRVIVFFTSLLSVLDSVGVNVGRILALSGLGGLAFGWFGRDILSNIIGGLMVYLTQPFAQGDWVQSTDGTIDGWIQNIGIYYTVVMRWDKRPLYIPNSKLSMLEIINASRMTNRRILLDIPLKLRDADKYDTILEEIRELIQNHDDIDPLMHRLARLRDITPYSANIWLSCYTKSILLADYTEVRENLIMRIHDILRDHQTTFATNIERIQVVDPVRKNLLDTRKELRDKTHVVERQLTSLKHNQTALAGWEEELKKLSDEVEARKELTEKRQRGLDDIEQMLEKMESSLNLRSEALMARESALEKEKQAMMARRSDSLFYNAPQLLELEKEALKAKEVSLSKTEQAMETMKTVLDTRGEQLMQEREEQLLELLDSDPPEASKEKDSVKAKSKDSSKAKAKAGDKDEVDEEDEDLTEEERLKKLEREATAIGGE